MPQENPSPFAAYAPPAAQSVVLSAPQDDAYRPILKKFRDQMLALGVLWVLFGVLEMVVGPTIIVRHWGIALIDYQRLIDYSNPLGYIVMGTGAIWLLAGIGTLFRKTEAILAGLALSYLSLVGNFFALTLMWAPVIAIAFTAVVIIQAHRVLRIASQLRAAGVPLDTKP